MLACHDGAGTEGVVRRKGVVRTSGLFPDMLQQLQPSKHEAMV